MLFPSGMLVNKESKSRLVIYKLYSKLYIKYIEYHHEIATLKSMLYKNSYPCDFVDKCIKEFFDRVLS